MVKNTPEPQKNQSLREYILEGFDIWHGFALSEFDSALIPR